MLRICRCNAPQAPCLETVDGRLYERKTHLLCREWSVVKGETLIVISFNRAEKMGNATGMASQLQPGVGGNGSVAPGSSRSSSSSGGGSSRGAGDRSLPPPYSVATTFPQHSVLRGLLRASEQPLPTEAAYFYLGDCDARAEPAGCWGGCAWDNGLGTVCVGNQF